MLALRHICDLNAVLGLVIVAITGKQKRYLRGLAHSCQVIVKIGSKGLTADILLELDASLAHHELLKIKLPPLSKAQRDHVLQSICVATDSEVVQVIGHVGVIFRVSDPSRINLPG